MNSQQMMETWKAQDQAPLYDLNLYLLRSVMEQDEGRLRRAQRFEQLMVYAASAGLMMFLAVCLYDFIRKGWVWNVAGAALGITVLVAGAAALWLGHRKQARRERGFGASVSDEIRRGLSLIDYELSRRGRVERVLLAVAPVTLAGCLMIWLAAGLNEKPFGWSEAAIIPVLIATTVSSAVYGSRKARLTLEPRRQRLAGLLQSLNAAE